ncbi:alcohol acetyltransferase [Aspergillus pseudoustus]|uniref:Alcohol acetyltransferase n=1 Tax=Aspergillus pseudoustus TaxID=1810923 RepID=A0ABR4K167_9EURO
MENFEKLRPVGNLEKFSTVRHPLGYYYNVAFAVDYTIPETYTLPLKDYIYKAIDDLIQRHPILSAIPHDEASEEPYFVRLPEIDLSQPISFQHRTEKLSDSELESSLKEQHGNGFTAQAPYWRLIVFTDDTNDKHFTAVYVYHHALGDGGSGKAFHRTFLEALRGAVSLHEGEARRIVPSPKIPLLPNLETAHPLGLPVSLPYLLKVLFKEVLFAKDDPKLWAGGAIQLPLKTQLRIIALTPAQTSALVKACRENGTTVTCLIQTAFARALFPHIPEEYIHVNCSGAISSRSWLPDTITEDSMGVWVQEFFESYTRGAVTGKTFPWAEAKRSRKTILKELKLKSKNTTVGLLKFVKDYRKDLLESKLGKPRKSSYEVSSLGVVKTENPDDLSIPQMGRVVFSQSATVTGSAIEVSVITGADGSLVLTPSWQTNVVDDSLMQAVIDTFTKELHQLSS